MTQAAAARSPAKKRAGGRRTPEGWQDAFLAAYRVKGTATAAAAAAKVGKRTAYEERTRNPEFAKAWDALEGETTKLLEESAFERAMKGDMTLTIFMLKARNPSKFRDNVKVEHGGTITHEVEKRVNAEVEAALAEVDRLTRRLADVAPDGEASLSGRGQR